MIGTFSIIGNNYKTFLYQDEIIELSDLPEFESNFSELRGILFTKRIQVLYKNGDSSKKQDLKNSTKKIVNEVDEYIKNDNNKEIEPPDKKNLEKKVKNYETVKEEKIELGEEDDTFYSKLALGFLEQYYKFGMYFFYYYRDKEEDEPKPYVPDINGRMKFYYDKNGKFTPVWFDFKNGKLEKTPNNKIIFVIIKIPNLKKSTYRSKIFSLFESLLEKNEIKSNTFCLEKGKLNPDYYLQDQPLPIAGENTGKVISEQISIHADNKNVVSEENKDFFTISEPISELYSEIFQDNEVTNQDLGCNERIAISTDRFVRRNGVPFLRHRKTKTNDLNNPKSVKYVTRYGSHIKPEFIKYREHSTKLFEITNNNYKEKVDEIFGIRSVRNLDKTKFGASMLVKSLNENINTLKELTEEMLRICMKLLIESKQGENISLKIPNKTFIGFRVNPKNLIDPDIIVEVIKNYPNSPAVVNEILEMTSTSRLKSLEDLEKKMEKEKKDEDVKMKEKEQEKKDEDVKMKEKKDEDVKMKEKENKDEDVEMKEKKVKASIKNKYETEINIEPYRIISTSLNEKFKKLKTRKYKNNEKLKVSGENRTFLNGQEFTIIDTVSDYYDTLSIWAGDKMLTPCVYSFLNANKKFTTDVLYVGMVNSRKEIVSENNLNS